MLIVSNRRRAVALAQFLPVHSVNHRKVRECRQLCSESAVEQDLFWSVRDVVVAPHDDGYSHCDVIGHDGEVVDRRGVGAEDDEVLDVLVRKSDAIVDHVIPFRRTFRHAEADHVWLRGDATIDLLERKPVTPPVVLERFLSRRCFAAPLVQLGGGAKAAIGCTRLEKSPSVGLVPGQIRALVDDLPVPAETQPLETLKDRARAFVGAPRLVGVFDPEEELATEFLRVEPVIECRARAADVEVAGRRGGKPQSRPAGIRHSVVQKRRTKNALAGSLQ